MITGENIRKYFLEEKKKILENQKIAKENSLDIIIEGIFKIIKIQYEEPIDYTAIRTGMFELGSEIYERANSLTKIIVNSLSDESSKVKIFTSDKRLEDININEKYFITYSPVKTVDISLQHPRKQGYIKREPKEKEELISIKPYKS